MLKRKKKNKGICLLLLVGFFLIMFSFLLVLFNQFIIKNKLVEENNLKNEFYRDYEEIRNTPKVEFQEELQDIVIEQPKEETTPTSNINYIGILKIDKINLEKGFVDKMSPYNNVDINIQILKDSDMPDDDNGNVILAGHSGSGKTAYFRNLYKLGKEDLISIFYKGYEYKYKVVNIYDIDKIGTAHIIRNANKNTLTLITCRDKTEKQIIIICEFYERN